MRQTVSIRRTDFASAEAKAKWLDSAARLDVITSAQRDGNAYRVARFFAQAPVYDPNDPAPLARDLQAYVRDWIRYVHDPLVEEFTHSDDVIERGFGDCDDKVRLYSCLCNSIGIPARVAPVFNGPQNFVHVRAEVLLRYWRPVELIVRDLPLGKLPKRGDILA